MWRAGPEEKTFQIFQGIGGNPSELDPSKVGGAPSLPEISGTGPISGLARGLGRSGGVSGARAGSLACSRGLLSEILEAWVPGVSGLGVPYRGCGWEGPVLPQPVGVPSFGANSGSFGASKVLKPVPDTWEGFQSTPERPGSKLEFLSFFFFFFFLGGWVALQKF